MPPITHLGHLPDAPPAWHELLTFATTLRLHRSLVWRGDGVPAGGGRPVLLIPGFMGGDGSLRTLRRWLVRMGYRAEPSGLIFNVLHSEAVMGHLEQRLEGLWRRGRQPVALVGHSRGGLLAKVLAERHPLMVARVVGLGSPFADPFDVHPLTMAAVRLAEAYNLVRFRRGGAAEERFLRDLAVPARVPLTSIYSRQDGIVHWEACLRPDADSIEIDSSHTGFPVNPDAYVLLGQILSGRRS